MTALAPFSMAYLMVGSAPTMRWLLVMFFSASRGTLKSTCESYQEPIVAGNNTIGTVTYADKDALSLDVDVGDRELVGERHGAGIVL